MPSILAFHDIFRQVVGHRLTGFRIGEFEQPLTPRPPAIRPAPIPDDPHRFVFDGIGKSDVACIRLRTVVQRTGRRSARFSCRAWCAQTTAMQLVPIVRYCKSRHQSQILANWRFSGRMMNSSPHRFILPAARRCVPPAYCCCSVSNAAAMEVRSPAGKIEQVLGVTHGKLIDGAGIAVRRCCPQSRNY